MSPLSTLSGKTKSNNEQVYRVSSFKVLAVDVKRRRLVTCGSLFQGTCQLRDVEDISDAVQTDSRGNTDYFVAANDPLLSTVAFVAPGPSRIDALYVAATYTGTAATAVRQAVPAVSVRSLDDISTAFRFDCLFLLQALSGKENVIEQFNSDYSLQ